MKRIVFAVMGASLLTTFVAQAQTRFVRDLAVNTQPTVQDQVTGLEWQGCAAGQSGANCATGSATMHSWSAALSYCEGLSYGGHADWRLPSCAELQSIVDSSKYAPAIDAVAFPYTSISRYWSSSSCANGSTTAWYVLFNDGFIDCTGKSATNPVRCVRNTP